MLIQTFHSTVTFLRAGLPGKGTDEALVTFDGVSGSKI